MTHRTRIALGSVVTFVAITALVLLVIVGLPTQSVCADASCEVGDDEQFAGDIAWDSGTAFTVTLDHAATTDVTVTFPTAASSTLVSLTEAQTLTNKSAVFGHTAPVDVYSWAPEVQIIGTEVSVGPALDSSLLIYRASDDPGGATLFFGKEKGAPGDYTAVTSGNTVGSIYWMAADGSDTHNIVAGIAVKIGTTPGTDDTPGHMTFSTTPDGSNAPAPRLEISHAGDFDFWAGNLNNLGHSDTDFTSTGATFGVNVDLNNNDLEYVGNANTSFTSAGATFGVNVDLNSNNLENIGNSGTDITGSQATFATDMVITDDGTGASAFVVQNDNPSGDNMQVFYRVAHDAGGNRRALVVTQQSRGTLASPTATQLDDALGAFLGAGYDGSAFVNRVGVHYLANENWTGSARGTRMEFETTTDGAAAGATRMTLEDDGTLDHLNNDVVNVGAAGTDFTSSGATFGVNVDLNSNDLENIGNSGTDITGSQATFATDMVITDDGTGASAFVVQNDNPSGDNMQVFYRVAHDAGGNRRALVVTQQSRGTLASPTATQLDDALGAFLGAGYDGSAFVNRVGVHYLANENWTGSARGTRMEFETTTDGAAAGATRMTLEDDGTLDHLNNDVVNIGAAGTDFTSSGVSIGPTLTTDQPRFLAHNSVTDTDVTGDGTQVTLDVDTEVYDDGNNFAADTFTAPVTGTYLFTVQLYLTDLDGAAHDITADLITSNRSYRFLVTMNAQMTDWSSTATVIADMDATDTAYVTCSVGGGAKTVDVVGGATTMGTYFAGFLLG